ncbi:MAG: DUF748 domain-containing protein [Deltaproteobacteria bacterium]|nr:DUF748 domain-containing protein [Deltaproteobacteria bacterium]
MAKLAKIGMVLGGTLVFLLVSLSILVKVLVTPEQVRENLLPLLEKTLQRKVEIGQVDIGIFSGIYLTDLRIQKKDADGDFITVKSILLHYKLPALLSGDLVIDHIRLEQPRIVIVRSAAGRFNFDDIIAAERHRPAAATPGKKKSQSPVATTSILNLLINDVSIQDGEILFVDRSQNAKSPFRYTLDKLNFRARQMTLDQPFPIEFSAELNGSKITVSGNYNIAGQTGALDMRLTSLDLVQFAPYYRRALPGILGSGSLMINTSIRFQPGRIAAEGKVQFENLDLVLNALPDAPLQQGKLGLNYALNYDIERQQLDISTLTVNLNDTLLTVQGDVELNRSEPELALTLVFDKLDLRKLLHELPPGLTKSLQHYSPAGQIDGRFELVGPPSAGARLIKSADIDLSDVRLTVDALRVGVEGKVTYGDQQVAAEKLLLQVADQQLNLKFRAANLLGDIIRGKFQLSAAQLDLNRILPEKSTRDATVVTSVGTKQLQVKRDAAEIGPFDIPLDMSGTLSVDRLVYRQLNLDQLRAELVLKDNYLKITQLRSDIGGGELRATADIDLGVKGLKYQGQLTLDHSRLVSLVSGLMPQAEQSVSGLLQWQNDFSGRGTIPDKLLKVLQLKGLVQLYKGKVSGSPLLKQLSRFLDLPDLEVLSFDTFEGRYDLRNGLLNLNGQLDSSKVRLTPVGTIAVDGSLNMKLEVRIASGLMQQLGVETVLPQVASDSNGWGVIPLTIKGTLASPKINVDTGVLRKQAAEKVKDEIATRLLEKIAPQDEDDLGPVKDLLKGTLKQLFGN